MASRPRSKPAKPYCGGQWTEARFKQFIRTALRKCSLRWGPRNAAKRKYTRDYTGTLKGRRRETLCVVCNKWHAPGEVEMDHVTECGGFDLPTLGQPQKGLNTLGHWVLRLLAEEDGWRPVCKACHQVITNQQRQRKKNEQD